MYKVIKLFTDLQDGGYEYRKGDEYPRAGLEPTEERIAELAGSDNKQGTPLIKEIKVKATAKKSKADEKVVPDKETK